MSSALRSLGIPKRVKDALEELVARLREVLGDVEVYLFGSYARGDWVEGSDVDIVVVSPRFEGMNFVERCALVRKLASPEIPFEILCYTPRELEELLRESTFLREVSSYWIRIA